MIAIIGGGIAGLSAAVALKQQGFEARVFERATSVKPVGAGIILSPNAMYILEQLRLGEVVRAEGFQLGPIRLVTAVGKTMQATPSTAEVNGVRYQSIGISRAALHHILYHQVADIVVLNQEVARIQGGGLYSRDGSLYTADAVLAADGVHSKIRRHLFPQVKLRYAGQTCWRALVNVALPEQHLASSAEFWGRGLRFGYVPIGKDEVYFYATQTQPAGLHLPEKTRKTHLQTQFRHFAEPVPTLLEAASNHNIVQHDLWDIPPLPTYHRGKILLIGDAAHAMTPNLGQGAAQALEDAGMIAQCLREQTDVEDAFAAFERARLAKVRQLVNLAWRIGLVANWQSEGLCTLRNTLLRYAPRGAANSQLERLMRDLPVLHR